MPKDPGLSLNKRSVDAVKPDPSRTLKIAFKEPKGLALIVYPTGRKSFALRYGEGSQRKMIMLGDYGALTVEDAEAKANKFKGSVADGRDPASEKSARKAEPTFSEWMAEYLKYAEGKKKTWKRDVQYMALAEELFGSKKISKVTPEECEDFFERTQEQRGDTSANRALASLKACLNRAKKRRVIASNPATFVDMAKEPPPRTRIFTEEEWGGLLAATAKLEDKTAKVGLVLLFSTACRLSEALNLRWEDVDLEEGTMRLPDPKSGKPQAIPLPAPVRDFLKTLPKTRKVKLPGGGEESVPLAYVVAGKYPEKPRADLKRAWKTVLETAKEKRAEAWKEAHPRGPKPPAGFLEQSHIHDVRRTVLTRIALQFGTDTAQQVGRHASPNTTWTHYIVPQDGQLRRALEDVSESGGIGVVLPFVAGGKAS